MKWVAIVLAMYASVLSVVQCQDYAEYARGAGIARRRNNRLLFPKTVYIQSMQSHFGFCYCLCRGPILAAAGGALVGGGLTAWFVSARLKKKHEKEQAELLNYLMAQEEQYKAREKQWQQEYRTLFKAYEEIEQETAERDYEEFKAPDVNNDNMISRDEFSTYVQKYLSSFPELSEKDFPKFDEFDLNHDGIVSFQEWQEFLILQKELEKQKAKKAAKGSTDKSATDALMEQLYEQSSNSNGFGALNKQIAAGARGAGNNARRAM